MNIIIKKATIRGSLFLSYEFEQRDIDVNNTIKTSSDAPIHDDLRAAFRHLIPHFAFICEEITDVDLVESALERPESYLEDPEHSASDAFFKYRVSEFQIIEKDGVEKITISGGKRLQTTKEISFSTPSFIIDTDYKFHMQLSTAIEVLKEEVLAYMQGKQAPKTQLEMFGQEEEQEEFAS